MLELERVRIDNMSLGIYDWCDNCKVGKSNDRRCVACLKMTLEKMGNISEPLGYEEME